MSRAYTLIPPTRHRDLVETSSLGLSVLDNTQASTLLIRLQWTYRSSLLPSIFNESGESDIRSRLPLTLLTPQVSLDEQHRSRSHTRVDELDLKLTLCVEAYEAAQRSQLQRNCITRNHSHDCDAQIVSNYLVMFHRLRWKAICHMAL